MLQVNLEDLGVVRFTSAPRGGAPLLIREQWIGVEVPCLFSHDGSPQAGDSLHDVVTGMEIPDYPGYIILQTMAIEALRKKSPEAADHWNKAGFPLRPLAIFLFSLESAEVVKPVATRSDFFKRYADA
jgi:hypothetical protein